MRLIDDAGRVWHRLWSVRLALLAAVLEGASVLLGYLLPPHPRMALSLLAACVSAGAALARVIAQPQLRKDTDA